MKEEIERYKERVREREKEREREEERDREKDNNIVKRKMFIPTEKKGERKREAMRQLKRLQLVVHEDIARMFRKKKKARKTSRNNHSMHFLFYSISLTITHFLQLAAAPSPTE